MTDDSEKGWKSVTTCTLQNWLLEAATNGAIILKMQLGLPRGGEMPRLGEFPNVLMTQSQARLFAQSLVDTAAKVRPVRRAS